jgi:hypothetical protein
MKCLLLIALSISISFAQSSFAAPSALGSCSTLDKKVTISGKSYHCIKTAKGNFVYAPLGVQSGTDINSIAAAVSGSDKNVDATVLKAYNAYNHPACRGKHPNFTAHYLTSANYSPSMLEKQKALFEQAMSCYSGYFDHQVVINIALVNEGDFDFLASQVAEGKPVFDEIKLRWAKFMMQRISSGAGRFAGSAGWGTDTNSAWVLMIDSTKSTAPDEHGAAHEFVHILQSYSKSVFYPLYGDGSTSADYVNLPPWFWEGTAELFSYASLSDSAGAFSAQMAQARLQGKESPSLNKITTYAGVVSTLQKLEAPSDQQANMMNYALGSVACEFLLATYGYPKYLAIMKNAGVYKDFNDNLKATISLTQDEFFTKAAPFVLSQWKLSKF